MDVMSPIILFHHSRLDGADNQDLLAPRVMSSEPPTKHEAIVLEGWAEGFSKSLNLCVGGKSETGADKAPQ